MEQNQQDERFMRAAICEATRGESAKTAPNPRVGAVIVEAGEVVSQGHFEQDGGLHAERRALEALGRCPKGDAVLYVTLEPCSTQGRTGACTDAILQAGIRCVVIGASDPTLAHRGNGRLVLEAAGVTVRWGVLQRECEALNPGYRGRSTT